MTPEQISDLIPDDELESFTRMFLSEYLKDGFGAQGKRPTELHVFHLLETLGNLNKLDNNSVSHLLQITDSRAKSYRYESKLKYVPNDKDFAKKYLLKCLVKSELDGDSSRIKFVIEDPYVRKYFESESKKLGGVPDNSFNREIVGLRTTQLVALIAALYGEDLAKRLNKDFEILSKKDSKITFSEIRKNLVMGAAKSMGGGMVAIVKGMLTGDPT